MLASQKLWKKTSNVKEGDICLLVLRELVTGSITPLVGILSKDTAYAYKNLFGGNSPVSLSRHQGSSKSANNQGKVQPRQREFSSLAFKTSRFK